MGAAKIKKGDQVIVLAGRDKGKKGEVFQVMPKEGRALVRGVNVVRRSLSAPCRQILDNAHVSSSSVIIEKIKEAGEGATYDVLKEKIINAHESGVLDVTEVLKTVLQTATSGALMALTTDTIVYHKSPEQSISI